MTSAPLPGPAAPDPVNGEPPRPTPPTPPPPPTWQPVPPAPPAPAQEMPPRRHLRRSTTNKVLGGVCGGLAEYSDSDPLLWRVGFIALAVMGAGVLLYPLLWLLVPAGPDDAATSGLHETLRKGRAPRSQGT